jgi:GAF domain-containing protein
MPTSDTPAPGLSRGQQPPEMVLDDVTDAVQALTAALAEEEDFRGLLQRVCEQVTRAVPGVDHATVTTLRDGRPGTPAATGEVVAELDATQYRTGQGPCLAAAQERKLVRASIDTARDLWPEFAAEAATAGMGSFLAAPITIDGEHVGAINCYSADEWGYADLDEQLLELFTSVAETAIRGFLRYSRARDLARNLEAALETRAVIDQAKGIIMAVRRIDADQAFAVLVHQSQKENVKLRDLATRFIAGLAGSGPPKR